MIARPTAVIDRVDRPTAAMGSTRGWAAAALFVVGGYMVLQRSFAYLVGIPALNLFVGEVLLVGFIVFHPDVSVGRLLRALLRPSPLGAVAWGIFLVFVYGLILAVRGQVSEYSSVLIVQEIVFNIYPLYILLGVWLAERDPRLLERFLLAMSWVIGIYGLIFMAYLNHSDITIPGSAGLLLFRAPLGQSAMLLALLAYRPKGARMWIPFTMNLLVLLGVQSRAAYAGFVVGLLVWAALSKRIGRMLLVVTLVSGLLFIGWVLNLRIEFAQGASEYSARNVAAAVIAPFDEEAAAGFSADARAFAGTAEWRKAWWAGIWDATHDDPMRTAFGAGYGYLLSDDAVLLSTPDDLRTPHNWLLYTLGYGGWVGVLVFAFLLLSLGTLLWRAERITRVHFGLPFLALSTTIATFSNFYETPFAAIPVWVLTGMAIAPAVQGGASNVARSARTRRDRVPLEPSTRPARGRWIDPEPWSAS